MRLRYLICLLMLAMVPSPLLAAERGCTPPTDIQKFFEQWREEIGEPVEIDPSDPKLRAEWDQVSNSATLLTRSGPATLQWLMIGWNEPKGGAVFVLDCDGKRLAAHGKLMWVLSMRKGPLLPALGPTVEILHVSAVGSGILTHSVQLLAFSGGQIRVLWDYAVMSRVFPFGQNIVSWKISDDGLRIHVSASRTVWDGPDREFGWLSNTVHEAPEETWCWNPTEKGYLFCR